MSEAKQIFRIGFSHNYYKLHNQTNATLLDCMHIPSKSFIHPDALEYDTAYPGGHYELEEGKELLMLLFMGDKGIPFTTYRECKPETLDKYEKNIGGSFAVYVKEDGK